MKEEPQGMSAACRRFEGELQSYLEGEARPFVAAHVRDCRSCSALLADLEEIRQVAGQMPGRSLLGLSGPTYGRGWRMKASSGRK